MLLTSPLTMSKFFLYKKAHLSAMQDIKNEKSTQCPYHPYSFLSWWFHINFSNTNLHSNIKITKKQASTKCSHMLKTIWKTKTKTKNETLNCTMELNFIFQNRFSWKVLLCIKGRSCLISKVHNLANFMLTSERCCNATAAIILIGTPVKQNLHGSKRDIFIPKANKIVPLPKSWVMPLMKLHNMKRNLGLMTTT